MAKKKKLVKVIRLQIQAGKATPAPPVGTALGPAGVDIMGFCKEFNARTQGQKDVMPVVMNVYADRSFDFIIKKPPMSNLIKNAAGIQKGSGVPNRDKVAKLTTAQVKEVAEAKMDDLNAGSIEAAMEIVKGTARSMGVTIEG